MNKIKVYPIEGTETSQAWFFCPACERQHGLPVAAKQMPKVWFWNGSLDKPTFHPSIKTWWVEEGPVDHVCHSFVREGMIEYCADSTHGLAGQTVPLPNYPLEQD